MFFAAAFPIWMAAGARPGMGTPSCTSMAASPITNASGKPGMERSRSISTLPARSSLTVPRCEVSRSACTPAAQKTLRASMRSAPTSTPASSTPVTMAPVRTSTPSSERSDCARRERSSAKAGRRRGPASRRMTRALAGSMRRKSRTRTVRLMSAMAPASSTPVGPPPTTTKLSSGTRFAGSSSFSADSKAVRMRRRISVACSTVLRPGAALSHSGCPK